MRNICAMGLVGAFLFLGACVSYSVNDGGKDEKVDLYLSTLDDKHFVWCQLSLEQCRKDFEKWKLTPRAQTILREYEKEESGQSYNSRDAPNVFRTRFVEESQFTEKFGNQEEGQEVSQGQDPLGKTSSSSNENSLGVLEELRHSPQIFGPDLPSDN